jgi:hypothetical protein
MADSIANTPDQGRPTTSRKNSEGYRSQPIKTRSPSMDKVKREIALNEAFTVDEGSVPASSDPPQEAKAKKKPRKLALRNGQASSSLPAPLDDKSIGVETKETSLDSRVSALEYEYRRLNKRTNNNAFEIGKLQATTKLAPGTETSKEEMLAIKAKAFSHQQEVQLASPAISPDHKSKDPHPTDLNRVEELSDEEIETIPRSEDPAVNGRLDQSRSVALKGSYKIPLPSTLSTDDVRAVQSGLAAASSVAREIATAMRGSGSGNRPVPGETGQGQRGTSTLPSSLRLSIPLHVSTHSTNMSKAPTTSTSTVKIDPQTEASSSRSWTSLLNSCTKLVSNAANAIEMEAVVDATRNDLLDSERGKDQGTNRRGGQRTTTTYNTGSSARQRPVERAPSQSSVNKNTARPEGPKPTTPPPKSSTRRRPSATAPTQSSASKSTTRAVGPRLTTQSKTRYPSKEPNTVLSERPRTTTRKMSNQSTSIAEKKLEHGTRPKAGSRMSSSSAL